MRCDNCGSTDTYIKNHEHIYQIKGKEIKFIQIEDFAQNVIV